MKIALVFPPLCDPTAPYISVPSLTGWLRSHGIEVIPLDANLEATEFLLHPRNLENLSQRIARRLTRLERKGALCHQEQMAYAALRRGKQFCRRVVRDIPDAVSVLRDASGLRFFDPAAYDRAVSMVEGALELVSAAFTPLEMDFTRYRTPFSLLDMEQIRRDAGADRNPFFEFFSGQVAGRLSEEKVALVGISVVYVSQIQQAYTLAHILRRAIPDVHLTVGGPAMTQMLLRLDPDRRTECLAPFDTAVLYEGEQPLLEIIRELEAGGRPRGIRQAPTPLDLSCLPAPDFDGLPLDRYLSPAPVLPYDSTRGCYWGKCAFCHYGLAERGTAPYRERPMETILGHLEGLSERHGARIFYLSQDVMAPKTVHRLSREIRAAGHPWRWATDLRPEPYFSPEVCRDLFHGGALAVSLGIESGAPRILKLIRKGSLPGDQRTAVQNMAAAGVAVEAMCFTDFPTETAGDVMETFRFLEENEAAIALFMCGCFELTSGSAVAAAPGDFGIRDVWHLSGDTLRNRLYYAEKKETKTDSEKEHFEARLDRASRHWYFRHYPWAGALSTAHTLLWYDRFGPKIFKELARRKDAGVPWPSDVCLPPDVRSMAETAMRNEAEIWHRMVHERRSVSPDLYRQLAEALPMKRIRKPGNASRESRGPRGNRT